MTSTIRDLAEAYLVLKQVPMAEEDVRAVEDRMLEAFLGCATQIAGAIPITHDEAEPEKYPLSAAMAALELLGVTDMDAAMAKWGLTTWPIMDDATRYLKIQTILSQIPRQSITVQEKSAGQIISAPFAQPDTTRCPRCGSSGKKFDWGFSCNNRECNRPNGKHTTWDEKNWQQRHAE